MSVEEAIKALRIKYPEVYFGEVLAEAVSVLLTAYESQEAVEADARRWQYVRPFLLVKQQADTYAASCIHYLDVRPGRTPLPEFAFPAFTPEEVDASIDAALSGTENTTPERRCSYCGKAKEITITSYGLAFCSRRCDDLYAASLLLPEGNG